MTKSIIYQNLNIRILILVFLCVFERSLFAQINFTQLKSFNYVYSKTILTKSTGETDLQENIQFLDFLGRPKQTVIYKGSPLLKDIIQPVEYDAFGREVNKYLPYASITANGLYRPSWKSEQAAFYTTTLGYGTSDGNRGFAQTVFDNSPESKVMKQGAPGNAWKIVTQDIARGSTEHILSYQYSANTSADVIYYWTISGSSNITFTRKTYLVNSLYKTITNDENNNTTTEFKDIQGKIILKVDAIGGKTYYVYDDFGLLRFVMPPLATPTLSALSSFDLGNTTSIELCYYYEYDHRNRMIKKKVPGFSASYTLAYDNLDRLIKTTDPNGISTYTDYDVLSRPIETGYYETGVKVWQTKTIYDKYNPDIDYRTNFPYQSVYYTSYETGVKGKITVTKTKVISPETDMKQELVAVSYYDKYGRVIQVLSENHKNGRDRISYKYKYINSDLVAETKHEHGINGTTYSQSIIEKFNYDINGRLLSNSHKIGTRAEIFLSTKTYDEAARLKSNTIGNKANEYKYNIRGWITAVNNLIVCSPDNIFGYELTYTYNGNITKNDWSNGASCFVKSYTYSYDQLNRLTQSVYSEIDHGVILPGSAGKYNETLTYDANGNILTAQRYGVVNDGTGLVGKIDDLNYVYFNAGKSNRLNAIGDQEPTFMGRGDFNEYTSRGSSTVEYSYDLNGNLRYDKNKRIWISYNYLNLPYIIKNEGGPELLRFIYDAGGKKVRQVSTMSATTKNTNDYIGPFVYKNGVLDYIITSDGRAVHQSGTFSYYEYHLKDHLGNVRLVFNSNGTTLNVLQTYDYYPFGMVMGGDKSKTYNNKYRYNGKEMVLTERSDYPTDLSWLDYGARFYDPQIGRWHSVDPLCELNRKWSLYTYAYNNPIRFIDPDGMMPWKPEYESKESSYRSRFSDQFSSMGFAEEKTDMRPPHRSDVIAKKGGDGDKTNKDNNSTKVSFSKFNGIFDLLSTAAANILFNKVTTPDNKTHIIKDESFRSPDFYTFSFSAGLFNVGVSGTGTVDRFGQVYLSPLGYCGGKTMFIPVSFSFSANWLLQSSNPNSNETYNYLSGNCGNAGAGFILGGSYSFSPTNDKHGAVGIGLYSPQIGVSHNYTPPSLIFNEVNED